MPQGGSGCLSREEVWNLLQTRPCWSQHTPARAVYTQTYDIVIHLDINRILSRHIVRPHQAVVKVWHIRGSIAWNTGNKIIEPSDVLFMLRVDQKVDLVDPSTIADEVTLEIAVQYIDILTSAIYELLVCQLKSRRSALTKDASFYPDSCRFLQYM